MVGNHFSVSFCRALRTVGFGRSEGSVHPCITTDKLCRGINLHTQYRATKGKGCLSDFAVREPRLVDAEFGESFNCFYCA